MVRAASSRWSTIPEARMLRLAFVNSAKSARCLITRAFIVQPQKRFSNDLTVSHSLWSPESSAISVLIALSSILPCSSPPPLHGGVLCCPSDLVIIPSSRPKDTRKTDGRGWVIDWSRVVLWTDSIILNVHASFFPIIDRISRVIWRRKSRKALVSKRL